MSQKTKILIVDDMLSIHDMFGEYFEYYGLAVESATTGREGLVKVQRSYIGAVFVDDFIGDMTGVEFASLVRKKFPEKRMFFVGNNRAYWADRLIGYNLDDLRFFEKLVLVKPDFDALQELISYIEICLEEYQASVAGEEIYLDCIDIALYQALQKHPELLKCIDWRKFEELLADVLENLGYEVELMQGSKDGGVDIVALKASDYLGGHRYLVQAKRWDSRVGIEPVQRLLFQQSRHLATKSCLATTSTFTKGAWTLAREYQWQLELRDYNGLRHWIEAAMRKKQERSGKL